MKILAFVVFFIKRILKKNAVREFVAEFVNPSILIVQKIKEAVDSKTLDALVELTKTDLDDKWKARLSEILAKAINRLYLIDNWADVDPKDKTKFVQLTHEEIVTAFINELRKLKKPAQSAMLHKLASSMVVNQSSAVGKPKEFEAGLLVSLAYSANKEGII